MENSAQPATAHAKEEYQQAERERERELCDSGASEFVFCEVQVCPSINIALILSLLQSSLSLCLAAILLLFQRNDVSCDIVSSLCYSAAIVIGHAAASSIETLWPRHCRHRAGTTVRPEPWQQGDRALLERDCGKPHSYGGSADGLGCETTDMLERKRGTISCGSSTIKA